MLQFWKGFSMDSSRIVEITDEMAKYLESASEEAIVGKLVLLSSSLDAKNASNMDVAENALKLAILGFFIIQVEVEAKQ